MKIKNIAIKFLLILFGLCFGLLISETFLEFNGWVYKKIFYKRISSDYKKLDNNKYTFLFIGDSWTEGGEAPPSKGFPEQFVRVLSKNQNKNYSFKNIGYASSNSSYAVLKLISEISKNQFKYVFVLTGLNNGCNIDDVQKVGQIAFDMYGLEPLVENVKINIFFKLGFKRIGKLFAIYTYDREMTKFTENFRRKNTDSKYVQMFNDLLTGIDLINLNEKAWNCIRETLLGHHKLAKDYDEFYKVIKLTFGNKHYLTEEFLKSKDMWSPELIKNLALEKEREAYLEIGEKIAERDLRLITKICKTKELKLILQTYPEKRLNLYSSINKIIRNVAADEGVIIIDQDEIFRDKFNSEDELKKMFANHHPNEKGYAFMAENILQFFINNSNLQL